MRSGVHLISKNAWGLVAQDLSVQDLLQLRGTCKWMNNVVTSMNSRWYRAHQWFLVNKGDQRKAKCAIRCHTQRFTINCISYYHKRLSGVRWNQRDVVFARLVEEGGITEKDCHHHDHWIYKVPQNEQEIPLDKGYKPKRNVYMFWYLIEVYRHKTKDIKEMMDRHKESIHYERLRRPQMMQQIEYLHKAIAQSLENEKQKVREYQAKKAAYEANNIFEGVRINCYKGFETTTTKKK